MNIAREFPGPIRNLRLAALPGLAILLALTGLALALAFGWFAQSPAPAAAQTTERDYDADNDGLIEIDSLAQLNAVRWDLNGNGAADAPANTTTYAAAFPGGSAATATRMGCPAGACTGYELIADLDFDADGSGAVTSTDPYPNWTALGQVGASTFTSFTATFDGNGRTISNLTTAGGIYAALFARLGSTAIVQNLGLIDPSLSASSYASGIVVTANSGSEIRASYVQGGAIATISANNAGGLVGWHGGTIRAAWSTAAISGVGDGANLGGLVASNNGGTIIASYAAGPVTNTNGGSNSNVGGLVGSINAATITDSYCDSTATGQSACLGDPGATSTAYTTTQLQSPTTYAGIYANWNLDLNADSFPDNPWRFGSSADYPTINPPNRRIIDYDADNDRLIDIANLHQLNAIRYDRNGDGLPASSANYPAYARAFPGADFAADSRMGCPTGYCAGYELIADLDFDADGDGTVTSTDPYPNFTPIGTYTAVFEGNGHTIARLTISTTVTSAIGLFSTLGDAGVIRNVGMVNASVHGGRNAGILVGINSGRIETSYVQGGTVSITNGPNGEIGGLASRTRGNSRIFASYASALVTTSGTTAQVDHGGLVGAIYDSSHIVASYASGRVTDNNGYSPNRHAGLIGRGAGGNARVINSYCDSQTSGQSSCIGAWWSGSQSAAAYTTTQLQSPTGYTGIYANWNLDLNADGAPDDPWNFGAASDYPTPKIIIDYDRDDDSLIEVTSLDQLNALRYDLDGNGDPAAGATSSRIYAAAFPRRSPAAANRMGCPAGNCRGYELTADLEFDTNNSGAVTADDAYPNWNPIGGFYNTTFEGNGRTITRMTTDLRQLSAVYTGLFHSIGNGGMVRNVGLVDATVQASQLTGTPLEAGILAGQNRGAILGSYIQGGLIETVGNRTAGQVGGLVGVNYGTIRASYSTAAVRNAWNFSNVGGLAGRNHANIAASYAAGPVSSPSNTQLRTVGGLIGRQYPGSGPAAPNYCSAATGQTTCIGRNGAYTVTRLTAAQMQAPADYAGIYALWNVDITGDAIPDDPWDFGAPSQYPRLKPGRDYDTDNDGLIEINSLHRLNAIRHDMDGDGVMGVGEGDGVLDDAIVYDAAFPHRLDHDRNRMGCPNAACIGYELTANLDFDTNGDGMVTTTDAYPDWDPLGGSFSNHQGIFDGNGHTISNLTITDDSHQRTGLFAIGHNSSVIRNVGMLDANFTIDRAAQSTGVLVGTTLGEVVASYAQGGSITVNRHGFERSGASIGGLVGVTQGAIRASYAAVQITSHQSATPTRIGGLAGQITGAEIIASYAAGSLTGTGTTIGGLVGLETQPIGTSPSTITDSYCDSTVHTTTPCLGTTTTTIMAPAYSTAQLQAPTTYAGIYANWHIDLDGDSFGDHPWNFGTTTTYPTLNPPDRRTFDYDADNDGLIEIINLHQLHAVRWDLDGNGAPTSTATSSYRRAFAAHDRATATRMGCPAGACTGYELAADLDFDANNDGAVAAPDPYPNWAPIGIGVGPYAATFNGNGHTISNLTISTSASAGLFNILDAAAIVQDLGLINPTVSGGSAFIGPLAANSRGALRAVYVQGGTVAVTGVGAGQVGGLVGRNGGTIRAAYSTASVNGGARASLRIGGLAGFNDAGAIIASYAAGPVAGTGANANLGGLIGQVSQAASAVTNSYCDSSVQATTTPCIGNQTGVTVTAAAYSAAQLQAPRSYAGIYADWNIDLNGDAAPDHPWGFGTSQQYPQLYTPAQRALWPFTDYDPDADGLLSISSLTQLNALRYDLNTDGVPSNPAAWTAAFPNRDPLIRGGVTGYELTASLNFDTNGNGSTGAGDQFPNWDPIGRNFTGTFNGNGHTLTGLRINHNDPIEAGLFEIIGNGGLVRDLGMINASITAGGLNETVGIIAGENAGTIYASYAQGGSVTVTQNWAFAGGLAGYNLGAASIVASWSTAAVSGGTITNGAIGGLVGNSNNVLIQASYAAGAVTGTGAGTDVGGLIGSLLGNGNRIVNSYCDTSAQSTTTPCIGDPGSDTNAMSPGYTTAQLQAPTAYTGIYAHWNIDLDGDTLPDHPWHFGAANQYPALRSPAQRAAPADYDPDNDNLIDINSLHQLNAIRHDLNGDGLPDASANYPAYAGAFPGGDLATTTASQPRMGCPQTCTGYELAASLDFDADGNGMVTSTDPYPNWNPLGGSYNAIFEGNGRTIRHLTINNPALARGGLFRGTAAAAQIRNLGMLDASISIGGAAGPIAGILVADHRGAITASYIQGGSVAASANSAYLGGMVGLNQNGAIKAAYSTAAVNAGAIANGIAGGLVGQLNTGSITASYAAAAVTGTGAGTHVGGLVGQAINTGTTITDSYCDTSVHGTTTPCVAHQQSVTVAAPGYTTAQLQTPTAYAGIYANWNIDLDGDQAADHPWNFGTTTQYPTINPPSQRLLDYDSDNDGLIEISTLHQLNAIRYDLDGNGAPTSTATTTYRRAFPAHNPAPAARMGCPAGACTGYELAADLDFDTDGNGMITAADAYPNWPPIGPTYTAIFDGNGHTIRRLTIDTAGIAGLFSTVGSAGGIVRNVGILDPSISAGGLFIGPLAGNNGGIITAAYARGGTTTVTGTGIGYAGGLVGRNGGTIRAAYAAAPVNGGARASLNAGGLVGFNEAGTIIASYAAAPVSGTGAGARIGGLIGRAFGAASAVTNSYCDTSLTGAAAACIGFQQSGASVAATGYTTAQLQTPTAYTGIYADWNISTNADPAGNRPWGFGSIHQYPVLYTPAQRQMYPFTDYDTDRDGLTEVANLQQLYAIRWDLDGDAVPSTSTATSTNGYQAAFPGRDPTIAHRAGYELAANLDFDTNNDGSVGPGDAFPNWQPIGPPLGYQYTATFDGDGHTISNLTITGGSQFPGLFDQLARGGIIRDLGIIDPSIRGGQWTGVIASVNHGEITASYVQGGSVGGAYVPGASRVIGGFVGRNNGAIRAGYSTASVDGVTSTIAQVGGLAGATERDGLIIASYAAGPVSGLATTSPDVSIGGLVGYIRHASSTITDSYCDTSAPSTTTPCIGRQAGGAAQTSTGYTTTQLQTPTAYTGIYANWNIDLDQDNFIDNPWNFGASSQYPRLNPPSQRIIDYDTDGDGLIEITNLHQLNAIRYDLDGNGAAVTTASTTYYQAFPAHNRTPAARMGCPAGACTGYELNANLDFAANGIAVTTTDPYPNWTPIGPTYASTFDGNGHTISRLTISGTISAGLFGTVGSGSVIRDVGLIDASISAGGLYIGVLAGTNAGVIHTSYAQGGTVTVDSTSGGSYAGGLVGRNRGTIRAGYATAAVNAGMIINARVGGLAGLNENGSIIAGYAAGAVSGVTTGGSGGGLVAEASGASAAITNSYCDTSVHSTTTPCIGNQTSGASVTAPGYPTAQLQTPTAYTGPYAAWNISIDADAFPDYPWNFASTTTYPALNSPAQRQTLSAQVTDYDQDNDNLIDINTLDQLNAIRYDLNGNGLPAAPAAYPAYVGAFPHANLASTTTPMGCPQTCAGYELTADLDFAADGIAVTTTDPYPNWTPIGPTYAAAFNGNGRTITRLTINTNGYAGLFHTLDAGAVIRDLGIINASVTGSGNYIGILVGYNSGQITASYAQGGSVTSTNTGFFGSAGGLTGVNAGTIRAAYATASVNGATYTGGLVGANFGGVITASYAAGGVSGTNVGGLVGQSQLLTSSITNSYCDNSVHSTATPCIGVQTGGAAVTAPALTTAQLQTPTAYAGPYAHWNISIDADAFPDYPWNFASTTTYPALNTPAQRQTLINQVTDYDLDGDNLIEISNLHQLNALRYDLDGNGLPAAAASYPAYVGAFPHGNLADTTTPYMGCAQTCRGYELTQNLDFAANGIAVTTTDAYPDWTPISAYASLLAGNGHTIRRLTITGAATDAGLFNTLESGGVIRDLGMLDASITTARPFVGILAAVNSGEIIASYAQGGTITITAGGGHAGGLVGFNSGAIRAAYATASIDAGMAASARRIGGLVGGNQGAITAAYAAGPVSAAAATIGGFAGVVNTSAAAITDSYCDTSVHNTTTPCLGAQTGGASVAVAAQTTAQLQQPPGYGGIYANWNLDLDGDSAPDHPWHFGAPNQYPALNRPNQRTGQDYDTDNDGLIDIRTLLQLNAIRYDLDGNGLTAAGDALPYGNAFPGAATATNAFMGCPAGTCAGYELAASLDFDTTGDQAVTAADLYPDWTPIGPYASVFDGNANTITRLTIAAASGNAGLFSILETGGLIRDLGLLDASISGGGPAASLGALVGENRGRITAAYAQRGSVTLTADGGHAGGLVGANAPDAQIRAAYSTAAVNAGPSANANAGGLIGLHQGHITAAYAAGPVTGGAAAGAYAGGFAGRARGASTTIAAAYCDTDINAAIPCLAHQDDGANVAVTGQTTAQLQSPTDYTGIYQNWNISLDPGDTPDYPWNFGAPNQYPTLNTPNQRQTLISTQPVTPEPTDPDPTDPDPVDPDPTDPDPTDPDPTDPDPTDPDPTDPDPTDPDPTDPDPTDPDPTDPDPTDPDPTDPDPTDPDPTDPVAPVTPEPEAPSGITVLEVIELEPYDADSAHPEIYTHDQYEAAVTCQTFGADPETGAPTGAALTLNLGTYTGAFTLTLSLWDGKRFITYEGQDIPIPTLEQTGQTLKLSITTDPANTRFRLDAHPPTRNLLLGYADCHTDDPQP